MEIRELKSLGKIIEYNKVSIEVKLIELEDGSQRYDIRKYADGEHQYRGISLEMEAAKNLFLVLGKEFGYIPGNITIDSLEDHPLVEDIKKPFYITEKRLQQIKIEERPVNTKEFVRNVNKVIDKKGSGRFSITTLQNWLAVHGYVEEGKEKHTTVINKTVRRLTPLSEEIGLIEAEVIDQESGEVTTELQFTPRAQRLIVDRVIRKYLVTNKD